MVRYDLLALLGLEVEVIINGLIIPRKCALAMNTEWIGSVRVLSWWKNKVDADTWLGKRT